MNVAFYGVTAWGNSALDRLLEARIDIWHVFTRTEAGPCPHFSIENFGAFAERRGCRVTRDRTPDDDPHLLEEMRSARIDLIVSCGFHRKIGPATLATATHAVNLHPSLLPRYRGSAPSNWAIINGETQTGISLHKLANRIDAGAIYLVYPMAIGERETAGDLRFRQAAAMADLLMSYVTLLRDGQSPPGTIQDENQATSYRAITRSHALIDPTQATHVILNLVRGTTPWPGAWLDLDGIARDVRSADRADITVGRPGQIVERSEASVTIGSHDGVIRYSLA